MNNTEQQSNRSGSGKELVALIVGSSLMVSAGIFGTYWIHSRNAEAASKPSAVMATPAVPEIVHADVYFDFKSARLRADAVRMLQDKASAIEGTGMWVVLVQGYADRQGPAEYNKTLARHRAEAVKQFLVELGVPEPSVKVVTIGQDGAVCDEPVMECQKLNRRVHLEIHKLTRAAALAPVRVETTDVAAP
jgi:outer membrane protein OmpA-like peptidoglycan-associated protein